LVGALAELGFGKTPLAKEEFAVRTFAHVESSRNSMKLDTGLVVSSLAEVATAARAAEEMGFDALWTQENRHDPFMPLAVAATTTSQIKLGTAIALAFPRSPMSLAYTAWDL
jgi:alkanesulfonate monooxygenase SsuD/methylene tetrahydromethanopterin reductase-like flavin-dependent oxidoreductase (luciferase family)